MKPFALLGELVFKTDFVSEKKTELMDAIFLDKRMKKNLFQKE